VWTQCASPPVPEGAGIKPIWDGKSPIDFWANITYECANRNLFFEDDRERKSFQLQCNDRGKFFEPAIWPRCVASKYSYTYQNNIYA
jgi:hypothetical protein